MIVNQSRMLASGDKVGIQTAIKEVWCSWLASRCVLPLEALRGHDWMLYQAAAAGSYSLFHSASLNNQINHVISSQPVRESVCE